MDECCCTKQIHKKDCYAKEIQYKQQKAILLQKIQLAEEELKEAKERETNLKKLNETIMLALNDLSNDNKLQAEIRDQLRSLLKNQCKCKSNQNKITIKSQDLDQYKNQIKFLKYQLQTKKTKCDEMEKLLENLKNQKNAIFRQLEIEKGRQKEKEIKTQFQLKSPKVLKLQNIRLEKQNLGQVSNHHHHYHTDSVANKQDEIEQVKIQLKRVKKNQNRLKQENRKLRAQIKRLTEILQNYEIIVEENSCLKDQIYDIKKENNSLLGQLHQIKVNDVRKIKLKEIETNKVKDNSINLSRISCLSKDIDNLNCFNKTNHFISSTQRNPIYKTDLERYEELKSPNKKMKSPAKILNNENINRNKLGFKEKNIATQIYCDLCGCSYTSVQFFEHIGECNRMTKSPFQQKRNNNQQNMQYYQALNQYVQQLRDQMKEIQFEISRNINNPDYMAQLAKERSQILMKLKIIERRIKFGEQLYNKKNIGKKYIKEDYEDLSQFSNFTIKNSINRPLKFNKESLRDRLPFRSRIQY